MHAPMKFATIVAPMQPIFFCSIHITTANIGVDNCQRSAYKQKRFSFKYARAFL